MKRGIEVSRNQDATQPPTYGTVEVLGLSAALLHEFRELALTDAQWRTILQVFVDSGTRAEQTAIRPVPMLGTYRVEDTLIRFLPRYPLIEGQRYRAQFLFESTVAVSASFVIPKRVTSPTRIVQIYPSTDVLPENLLRFYIRFSAPMREGESLEHIRLVDDKGQTLDGVFLDRREELWDSTGTRLTLLFDPGRVKSGLLAHERFGRALEPGRKYRLVIDASWRDARGERLLSSVEKSFMAAAAKLDALDVSRWQVHEPPQGTRNPLSIRFPAPLDYQLLSEFIHVGRVDALAQWLPGEITLDEAETLWQFRPRDPWAAGAHVVSVDTRLEDVAGNNLNGPFDRPITHALTASTTHASFIFHVSNP